MRAVVKYPGAKWNLADWIISHFPPHRSYLEPFFGSGAVLFSKSRSAIETINDRDNDVINLFEWIRKDPERLARAIYWTPYAREVYNRAWEAQYTETDSFQRAVDFYARMMMGHGFRTTGEKVGWKNDVQGRETAYAANSWCRLPTIIQEAAERLRGVQIENRSALELITRFNYPNVLIYADPPYLLQTRHGKQYRHEMTDADHRNLLDALKAHKGPVLLSGYESQMTSEHKVMEITAGRQVWRWKVKHSGIDNHYLDCEVYAACAADVMGGFDLLFQDDPQPVSKNPVQEKDEPEMDWIGGGDWIGENGGDWISLTGIYEMETAETIGYGDAVYWDAANKTVTKTADKNIPAGMAASETGASGGKIAVRID